jgi:hypothetical protein
MPADKSLVRPLGAVAVGLCAVLVLTAAAQAASQADVLAARAVQLLQKGRAAEGVALLDRALKLDPARRDLFLALLRAKKAAGTLTRAEARQLALAEQEASARLDAQLAMIRMGLLQVQSAQLEKRHHLALRRLEAVREAIAKVDRSVDVSVYTRKADALEAASRRRLPVALSADADTAAEEKTAPEPAEQPKPKISEEELRLAMRRVREGNVDTTADAFDPNVTADELRARALANQKGDDYHVSSEIIDRRLIDLEDEHRFYYEKDLDELVRNEVAEMLLRTKADLLIPRKDLSIPKDWHRRVAGRKDDAEIELVGTAKKAEIRRLDTRADVAFNNTPLKKAVKDLAARHGINLVIDAAALKAAGMNPDQIVVDLNLKSASLRSVLTWMCRPAGLDWSLEDNVYVITLPSKAKRDRYKVAYNVMDIALPTRHWRPITAREDWYAYLDRKALRQHSDIFRGSARDLAAGLPLLHYFGGPRIYSYGPDPIEAQRLIALVNAILAD